MVPTTCLSKKFKPSLGLDLIDSQSSYLYFYIYKQTLVLWVLNMSPFADYLVMYVYVICYLFYGFIKIFAAGKYFRKCFSYQDTKHGEDHDGGTRSYLCRQLPALINRAPTYLYIFNWEAFSVSWGLRGTSDEKWDKLIDPISQVIQTKFISLPLKNHPEVLLYLFMCIMTIMTMTIVNKHLDIFVYI